MEFSFFNIKFELSWNTTWGQNLILFCFDKNVDELELVEPCQRCNLKTFFSSYPQWESDWIKLKLNTISLIFSVFCSGKNDKGKYFFKILERSIENFEFEENNYYLIQIKKDKEIKIQDITPTSIENNFELTSSLAIQAKEISTFLEVLKNSNAEIKDIEKAVNSISGEAVKLPDYNESDSEVDLINKIMQITLYRLKIFIRNKINYDKSQYRTALYNFLDLFYKLCFVLKENTAKTFFLMLILHCSRTYIDPDIKSVERANILLLSNLSAVTDNSCIQLYELKNQDCSGVLSESIVLITNILLSEKFTNGLERFLFKYGCSSSKIDETLDFACNKVKIIFVRKGNFCGMCGVSGEIYISLMELEKILNGSNVEERERKKAKTFLISTFIHELGHAILREIFLGNPLKSSPRGKFDQEKLESGYDFEEIIFGVPIVNFFEASGITILENWINNGNNFLTKDEFEIQNEGSISLNKKFSGISCLTKEIFYK